MQLDLMYLVNSFNGTMIIVAILAVTGVMISLAVVTLGATIVIDLVRGDYQKNTSRFFGGYNMPEAPQRSQDDIFTERYQREKDRSEYRRWKKSKGY